jgi:hypothetical protein
MQLPLRRHLYAVLITVAASAATGRILAALRAYDPEMYRPAAGAAPDDWRGPWPSQRPGAWPTFGSNDRSRFDAVRALVDEGTWVIGRRDRNTITASAPVALGASGPLELATLCAAARQARIDSDRGIITEDGWQTVDKVLHPERLEYYSTKPPILTLVAAGEYWLLKKAFGWSIVADRNCVVRAIVWTMNVPLLVAYLAVLARLLERWGATDWGRLFVLAAACFATMVTPFLVTFNNHTIATFLTLLAVASAAHVLSYRDTPAGWGWYALTGLLAGLTACTEFPAAALAAGLFLVLAIRHPARAFLAYLPAVLVPVAVLLAGNWSELGRLLPAYTEFGGPWYTYEGSIWQVIPGHIKRSIDFAPWRGETKAGYTLHLLAGHHGWFSLYPINFLGLAGMLLGVWCLLRRRGKEVPLLALGACEQGVSSAPSPQPPTQARSASEGTLWAEVATCSLGLSALVIGFYLVVTHNYGGVTSGPRWLMWLTPLWLLAMVPVADRLARTRAGRALALTLLALSVLSASYPSWNPWRHPWIYDWMEAYGLLPY